MKKRIIITVVGAVGTALLAMYAILWVLSSGKEPLSESEQKLRVLSTIESDFDLSAQQRIETLNTISNTSSEGRPTESEKMDILRNL